MISIDQLRNLNAKIVVIGYHQPIIQSILDFDFISNKDEISIKAIISTGRKFARFFFGNREVLIPVFSEIEKLPENIKKECNLFINFSSARRVLSSTQEIFEALPNLLGGSIFAENVPERHSLSLYHYVQEKNKFLIGPSSVGLLIPKVLKLGAIGGVDSRQFITSNLFSLGNIAVISASGGMINEIINNIAQNNKRISFALSFGGDRFPILKPTEAFISAEQDSKTETIIYYGELGGIDEYEISQLLTTNKVTKRVIAFIAGTISDIFSTPPQFGHAKAIAKHKEESAYAKRKALKGAGAIVPETFSEFIQEIKALNSVSFDLNDAPDKSKIEELKNRRHALIATNISYSQDGSVTILDEELLSFSKNYTFSYIVSSLFLGEKIKSKDLEEFIDFILRLLVDHGAYVSGAVNTIIAARAGKDLVSSLSSGLLTIGQRFGGAINQAAINWLEGVTNQISPYDFVESYAKQKTYIAGIGHLKYRSDIPDQRVKEILTYTNKLSKKRFVTFAQEVEKITTSKKGNLILNVDGAIAAVLLDLLSEKEGYTDEKLKELTKIEFFNAFFILSRSVGFIAHFLDQKRLDEGLFRLPDEMVIKANVES